jgi:integrase
MAEKRNRLTALKVATISKRGRHVDGGGLVLQVSKWGTKAWIFRYELHGREHQVGLGPLADVSLKAARDIASEYRHLLRQARRTGDQQFDPIEVRVAERQRAKEAKADRERKATFRECAEGYIAAHSSGWKNAKHRAQWSSTLATYAYPIIGALAPGDVETSHVLEVLNQPIETGPDAPATSFWLAKPETASRLRGRIESVLDSAKARQLRTGENPARWRGHLKHQLPPRGKVARVRHHPALPYAEISTFIFELQQQRTGIAARALEFTILTVARTNEVIGARWPEINHDGRTWTIPAARMKADRDHRVPLCDRALQILAELPREGDVDDGFIFFGPRTRRRRRRTREREQLRGIERQFLGQPLSNNAMLKVLERMERTEITVHGFRSTFRDWAAEETEFPNHVVEMALAHAIGDDVEAAYRRGDLFRQRRRLMDAWAKYARPQAPQARQPDLFESGAPGSNVVNFGRRP